MTVREIVFPDAVDFKQAGVDQPLAVFERVFAIGVQFDVGVFVRERRDRRAGASALSGL